MTTSPTYQPILVTHLAMMKYFSSLLILSFFYLQTTNACPPVVSFRAHVYIVNNLPHGSEPLKYHCASKDDDFGDRQLNVNESFTFSFCVKPFATLYFCHFWWNQKDKSFVVFKAKTDDSPDGKNYYSVQSDGFYKAKTFPPLQNNLKKVESW